MAIDVLQNKIRKLKNPTVVGFSLDLALVNGENSTLADYAAYARELLSALKATVGAVRFSFGSFALAGVKGLAVLESLLEEANHLGYYVLLDAPQLLAPEDARLAAGFLEGWRFDGLVMSAYLGTDVIKPLLNLVKEGDKDLFVMLRSANKSAPQLQDLLTGGRLVHLALADQLQKLGDGYRGRSGYSRLCGIVPATSAQCCKTVRSKYQSMFLLVDGYDYSGANAKNCAAAFDKLGHGAAVCVSTGITAAWKENPEQPPIQAALDAAARMKKNLSNYLTIL